MIPTEIKITNKVNVQSRGRSLKKSTKENAKPISKITTRIAD
jgi:hypothetical protein